MAKNTGTLIKGYEVIRQELFYFFSATLFFFVGLEIIWPNIILVYFNINILVILWFFSGLLVLFKK